MIDFEFVRVLEGDELVGYVPDPEGSKSGITISTGVDLHHTDTDQLEIEQELKDKLRLFRNFTGYDAIVHLVNNPLKLTQEESDQLSRAVYSEHIKRIATLWNRHAYADWKCIGKCKRTVVFSVLYQYGNPSRVPRFWQACTEGNWGEVITELRHFGDRYPTRRNKEADYLESCND